MKNRKQKNDLSPAAPIKSDTEGEIEYYALRDTESPDGISYIPKLKNVFKQALAKNEKIDVGKDCEVSAEFYGEELI